jgi:hypothetical protein
MGIASSPPKSGRDAPCHARNRGAQASILSSVLALGMAFDAYAQDIMSAGTTDQSRLDEWLKPLRVSLKHEVPYKFAAPEREANKRLSVRVEYSYLFVENDRESGDYVL